MADITFLNFVHDRKINEKARMTKENQDLHTEILRKDDEIARKNEEISRKDEEIVRLKTLIVESQKQQGSFKGFKGKREYKSKEVPSAIQRKRNHRKKTGPKATLPVSKNQQTSMDEVLLRFPHIGHQIFEHLDSKTLTRCVQVSKLWKKFINEEKIVELRMIQMRTKCSKATLKKVLQQMDAKTLATNVKEVYVFLDEGYTPLHWAAFLGYLNIYQLIIDKIDDKNPKSDSGTTPLHLAVKMGNLQMYQLIINNTVDKNPKDKYEETPLHLAASYGNFAICQFYMKHFEDKNPKDRFGCTPLHRAAGCGHLELFRLMREEVDDKNPINNFSRTPYDEAKKYGHAAICALIDSTD